MVVAVVVVRVMTVAADAVVDVVAVRHRVVSAAGAVARLMPAAAMVGGAHLGVLAWHLDHVLVDMAFVRVVEVTIMQIIDVAAVADGRVATARTMLMSMVGMGRRGTGRHGVISFPCPGSTDPAVGGAVNSLQSGGYRRDLFALVFSQLRHASLARSEPHEKPEPFRIAERSEHLGSGFDLYPRRKANKRARRMLTMPACQFRDCVEEPRWQYNNNMLCTELRTMLRKGPRHRAGFFD
jgi:hypothetical protein